MFGGTLFFVAVAAFFFFVYGCRKVQQQVHMATAAPLGHAVKRSSAN